MSLNRKEIWKDIIGYEDLYQVSNLGNVRSKQRLDSIGRLKKEKYLKPIKNKSYFRVQLYKNGKATNYLIHRLVACHFIDNKNNLPCVNHIDENTFNNCSSNLEWCTYEQNNTHGTRIDRVKNKCVNGKRSVAVMAINVNDNSVIKFPSMSEAERQTGIKSGNISNCCKGIYKTAGGYKWSIINNIEEKCDEIKNENKIL